MDSLIQAFENTELGFNIQSIHINDDMYFKGKDVASTLGYVDTASAIKDHVRQRHKSKLEQIIRASGAVECLPQLTYNEKQTIYITELGLYELALKSKLPALEQFQDWVYETIKKNQTVWDIHSTTSRSTVRIHRNEPYESTNRERLTLFSKYCFK